MTESEFAASARVYARSGWSVFPLWWVDCGRCACPAGAGCTSPGKHPLTRAGLNDASQDEAQIDVWWRRWPMANVGLPAGANGLAILDIDPRHDGHTSLARLVDCLADYGERLPDTLRQTTGGGGLHLLYRAPSEGIKGGSNVFGPSMTGLDTRGRGGYVVAAPSAHVSGQAYRWIDFLAEIADWPRRLSVLLDPPKPKPEPRAIGTSVLPTVGADNGPDAFLNGSAAGYAHVALHGEARRVEMAAEGERNHTLNVAAFNLGQLVAVDLLTAEQVIEVLSDAAAQCGLSGHEVQATIRSGLRGGARAPRDLPGAA
jgi:hypothetical protein